MDREPPRYHTASLLILHRLGMEAQVVCHTDQDPPLVVAYCRTLAMACVLARALNEQEARKIEDVPSSAPPSGSKTRVGSERQNFDPMGGRELT